MIEKAAEEAPTIDLMIRLRTETAAARARLDQSLDLLSPPLSRERFLFVMERLYGFLRVWEPAVAPYFQRDFFEPRRSATSTPMATARGACGRH